MKKCPKCNKTMGRKTEQTDGKTVYLWICKGCGMVIPRPYEADNQRIFWIKASALLSYSELDDFFDATEIPPAQMVIVEFTNNTATGPRHDYQVFRRMPRADYDEAPYLEKTKWLASIKTDDKQIRKLAFYKLISRRKTEPTQLLTREDYGIGIPMIRLARSAAYYYGRRASRIKHESAKKT